MGARDRCASPTSRTICASTVSRADALRFEDERAGAVHRAAGDARRRRHRDGDRFAGQHRLVDAALALDDDAIRRHTLTRPHTKPVADVNTTSSAPVLPSRRCEAACAVAGASERRLRMAALVLLRARSSSTWPSSTSTTMTAAGSK